jgi:hypothetical protein
MEGFSFVTPVTGLNRPNTGKEEEEDDDDKHNYIVRNWSFFNKVTVPLTVKIPSYFQCIYIFYKE